MNSGYSSSRLRRRLVLGAVAGAAAGAFPLRAMAQGLSSRPVRIILAQTPGTTPDLLARTIAPRMQARWNQPFVVENRAGASGAIGMEAVAKAPPDGHTINVNVSSTLTLPLFFKLPFDVLTGFAPISMLAGNFFALSVHSSVPAREAQEFIAYIKARPGQINYGSPGNGTYHHLFMEQFKLQTGIDINHIPYKGSGPAFTDLLGGHISAMFLPIGVAINMSKDGKVRVLGGSGRERSPLFPNLPSLHERGVSGFHAEAWFAAWGPAGLPADIVAKYNAELHSIMSEPDTRELLAKQGVSVKLSTPEELARINRAEYDSLAKIVREAKIKGD